MGSNLGGEGKLRSMNKPYPQYCTNQNDILRAGTRAINTITSFRTRAVVVAQEFMARDKEVASLHPFGFFLSLSFLIHVSQ